MQVNVHLKRNYDSESGSEPVMQYLFSCYLWFSSYRFTDQNAVILSSPSVAGRSKCCMTGINLNLY